MNIPQSAIDPFGVIGMPPISPQIILGELLDTMFKYSDVKAAPDERVRYFLAMMHQVCSHHKIEHPEVWRFDEEDAIKLIITFNDYGAIMARQQTYNIYRSQ